MRSDTVKGDSHPCADSRLKDQLSRKGRGPQPAQRSQSRERGIRDAAYDGASRCLVTVTPRLARQDRGVTERTGTGDGVVDKGMDSVGVSRAFTPVVFQVQVSTVHPMLPPSPSHPVSSCNVLHVSQKAFNLTEIPVSSCNVLFS
jgi:hypothetical protein